MLKNPSDFYSYQPKAIQFIKDHRYCALWVPMRLGKTISVLTAIQDLVDAGEVRRVLVVAPLRVSINSWPEDLDGWGNITLTWKLLRGRERERHQMLLGRENIHVINVEALVWLVNAYGIERFPYDMVILDESRKFKNHKVRTATGNLTRFGALGKVRPRINRLVELTGTPAPNGYQDLWAQMFLLDGGKRLGKNITAFRDRYMAQGKEHYMWRMRDLADVQIREQITDLIFVVDEKDYIDLPLVRRNSIPVTLPTVVYKKYKILERDYIVELQGKDLVASSGGVKANKLLQMASGRVYLEDETLLVHHEKEKALDELLELIEGSVLIIYNFVFEKQWILRRYPRCKLLDTDPQTLKNWGSGKIEMLLMHPASGGHGLNLFTNGNDIIWISPTYDLELWQQVNNRLSHPSKADQVITVHTLEAVKTVDSRVFKALHNKENVQEYLLENL